MLFLVKLDPEFSSILLEEEVKATSTYSLFLLAAKKKKRLFSCRLGRTAPFRLPPVLRAQLLNARR